MKKKVSMRKNLKILCYIMSISLLIGCGIKPEMTENEKREVPSKLSSQYGNGLMVEQGELKSSKMVFTEEEIEFQDPIVEEMIRNIIQKPEGKVLHKDLEEIHAIYWRHDVYWSNLQSTDGTLPTNGVGPWETKQPESLEDFAWCGNLQWMELGEIHSPSLQLFQKLELLEHFGFFGTSVTEQVLNELSQIQTLKELELAINEVMDWSQVTEGEFLLPLADQLICFDSGGNVDWDPEILGQMKKLELLRVEEAKDLSFLRELKNIKELYLYCPTIEDWSPLRECKNLEYLNVSGNMKFTPKPDVTMEDLQSLKKLEYLSLAFTQLQEEYSREEIIEALPSLNGLYLL